MTLRPAMPQIRAAFNGWGQLITFVKRTQTVIDGLVTYSDQNITFRGVIQPLSPKMIMLKPDGQRAWTWLQLHCPSTTRFNVNDQIIWDSREYKVMAENDYSLNGYIEYHLVRDYQG